MNLAIHRSAVGTIPGANCGLNSLDKVQAGCLLEFTRPDIFEEVADLFVKPRGTVSRVCKHAVAN